jgi:hypothetical protein
MTNDEERLYGSIDQIYSIKYINLENIEFVMILKLRKVYKNVAIIQL